MAHSTPSALYFPTESSGIGSISIIDHSVDSVLAKSFTGSVRVKWRPLSSEMRTNGVVGVFSLVWRQHGSALGLAELKS